MWNWGALQFLIVVSALDLILSWSTNDFKHSEKTQYFIAEVNQSFQEAAEETCFYYGGNLASFMSSEEFELANSKLSDSMRSSVQLWVGLRYNASSNAFVWTSANTVDQDLLSTIGISYNETITRIMESGWGCFVLTNDGLNSLVLQNCSSNHWVMCEVRGEKSAGDPSSDNPYTAYLSNVQLGVYARRRCRHHGDSVATFATMDNIQLAEAVIRELKVSSREEFWIDKLVRCNSKPRQFRWRTTNAVVDKEILEMTNITTSHQVCLVFHAGKRWPSITIEKCNPVSRSYLCKHKISKGVVETSKHYLVDDTFRNQAEAIIGCNKKDPKGTFRLARISEKPQLEKAQAEIKKFQSLTSRKYEYWTALSFTQGRGQWNWKWDEKESTTPNRNLTLFLKEEIKIVNKVCFFVTDKARLNYTDCEERKKFLCERVPGSDPDTTASTPVTVTIGTRSVAAAEKAKKMMSTFISDLQSVNVDRPDSLQYVVNETAELIYGLQKEKADSEAINAMLAAQEIENFAVKYAKKHLGNMTSPITIADRQFVLSMEKVPPNRIDAFVFPPAAVADSLRLVGETSITLPAKLFTSGRKVVSVLYQHMNKIVSRKVQKNIDGAETTTATRLNSLVIASSIYPAPDHVLEEDVIISLPHLKELASNQKPLCVFWDFRARTEHNGTWSTRGCKVLESHNNRTVCSCNHLTNFAVMMQVGKFETPAGHQLALSIITYIGCAVSLIGEILTVVAYTIFMNLKTEQAQIRVNLVISIAVAQIVFLVGIDATKYMAACISVAVLIHYFYLVAFCWMLLEGVYLYLMVVQVFNTAIKIRRYYLFAWGFPSLMVLTSIVIAATLEEGIKSYLHNKLCWVSFENNLVWTFVAPVLLICFLNMVILVRVVSEMAKLHSTKGPDFSIVKRGFKACVVLFPLLGLTWVFGVLSVTKAGLVFQYIFTIFNSFQGLFIFIFHVGRSHEIRQNFQRKKEIWTTTRSSNFAGTSRAMSNQDHSVSNTLQDRSKIDIRFPSTDSMDVGRHNQVSPSPL